MQYSFDEFTFNSETLSLQKDGVEVSLRLQPAKLLKHLLEAAPEPVSRRSLQDEIWSDGVNVEFEQSLNACVNQLRTVLGDQAKSARFIETLPKRGYRFVGNTGSASSPRIPWSKSFVFLASAIVTVVVFSISLFLSGAAGEESVAVYVAPIAIDFSVDEDTDGAIQYALRVGIVEQLIRYERSNFLVINGESLWEDVDESSGEEENAYDFVLFLNLRRPNESYVIDAVLSTPNRSAVYARTSIQLDDFSSATYANAAGTVSAWAAEVMRSGATPVTRLAPSIEYNTAYYRNMLNGQRSLRSSDLNSLVESLDWFGKALVIAPESPDALAGEAIALSMLVNNPGYPRDETYNHMLRNAEAIERIGGIHARAQLVRGIVYLHRDWDTERAKAAFGRASRLAPGDALVHSWNAAALAAEGDVVGALNTSSTAVSMDPMGQASNSDRCWYLNGADRFSESVQYCEWALEIDPNNAFNRLNLVLALYKSEQPSRAIEAMQPLADRLFENYEGPEKLYDTTNPDAHLRELYCNLSEILEPRVEQGTLSNYMLASFSASCGNYDTVSSLLETATNNREIGMLYIEMDAHFDEYRASRVATPTSTTHLPGIDSRTPS